MSYFRTLDSVPVMIDRLSKVVVIVSMGAAIAVLAVLVGRGWPPWQFLTAAAFGIALCLGAVSDIASVAIVLLFIYLIPAAVVLLHERYIAAHNVVWMAALLGAMIPRLIRTRWAVPSGWRVPLVAWALVVALGWPIVALREVDFNLSVLASQSDLGVAWVANVASILGIGILWFDWLSETFAGDTERFRRFVLMPVAASWLIASAVGVYQIFGDLSFVNGGLFGALGRASGTLYDANAFGAVNALATAGILALAFDAGRPRWSLAVPAFVLAWIGLWASGSRTALVAGLITVVAVGWRVVRPPAEVARRVPRARFIAVAAGALALLVLVASLEVPVIGAVRRLSNSLPGASLPSIEAFLHEMGNRNGYGSAAVAMIGDHPFVGVGVGGFHILVPEYSRAAGVDYLPPDNAQNWFRHQVAEFGILGSIGWIEWVSVFGLFLLSAPVAPRHRLAADMLRAALIGLVIASFVGMPGQNGAVAFTFWIVAFWFTLLAGAARTHPRQSALAWGNCTAIGLASILFVCGTAYASVGDLRPAFRAARNGSPYSYGFANPERGPGGLDFQWAGQRATIVLDAPKGWMRLVVGVNHLDITSNPVRAKVWCDNRLAVQTTLTTIAPVTSYVRVPPDERRIVLDTWVSRVVRPRDFGVPDDRELGLMVHWDFVDAPPPDAAIANVGCR